MSATLTSAGRWAGELAMAEEKRLSSGGPAAPAILPSPVAKTMETYDKRYSYSVMLVLAGIVAIVLYIEGMLLPSLPVIQSDFNVDTAQVSLVLSVYAISGVALSPVVGKLGDIYGKRKVMMAVMIAYAAAVSVTGFSPNFTFMVASRTVQGVGLTIMPLGMSLVREEFPRELVPRAQGLLSAAFGIGFAVSLPLGSWVSQSYGWRVTYHTAIPFVLLLTVAVFVVVRESTYRRPDTRVDYGGAALLGGSLASIVMALSEGKMWGWTSSLTLGALGLGLLLLVPFALWESRWKAKGGEPIVDPRLLKERNVAVTNVVLAVTSTGMFMAMFALIYRFEYPAVSGGFSLDILSAGIDIVPLALSMMGVSVVTSIFVSQLGVKPLALGGAILTSFGFLLLSWATTVNQVLLYEIVAGAGLALLNASIINLLILTVDPRDMGQATAMNNVFRNLGGSVGTPIVGSVLAAYVIQYYGQPLPKLIAFQYTFWLAAAVTLVGGVVVLFGEEVLGPKRHQKFAHHPQQMGRRWRAGRSRSSPEPTSTPTLAH